MLGARRAIRGIAALLITLGATAPVAHAKLSVPGGTGVPFTSLGSTTASALASFEAAIGGADNGTTVGEQGAGFRHVNWDAIAVDGSDPGSTTLSPGHVVAPAPTRLQPWGLELGPQVAVANDGFHSVNSAAPFAPYSAPNVWAPFGSTPSSTAAGMQVVAPSAQTATAAPGESRGLGVVFLNVTAADTSIQYFNGDIFLGSVPVPTGATSFAGMLFGAPVVTRVVITLGTNPIFSMNGSTPVQGSNSDLVAGDDIVLGEPAPARPTVAVTAGVPVSAVLDTFTESTPGSSVKATIAWGDGAQTAGTIAPGSGGALVVTGDHAYSRTGTYTATVTVNDFQGPEQTQQTEITVSSRTSSTSVTCSPSAVAVTATTTCTATVSDADAGTPSAPTGLVTFSSPTAGAVFPASGSCLLGPTATAGSSLCVVRFEPGQLPPPQARITATYAGDDAHTGSTAAASVDVGPQRCTVRALTRRLRPRGLGVLVTCDARAGVQVTVEARVAPRGRHRGFKIRFGTLRTSVTAGRPTVLVVKPAHGVLPALRAALAHHQRVSVKLTLTASSHATTRTTTTRVSALRLRP